MLCIPGFELSATTLSDNLSAVSAGTEIATGANYLTSSFSTDSSSYDLSTATLLLGSATGGTAELDLYSDGGLQPGTELSVIGTTTLSTSSPTAITFTSSDLLSTGATYWLVLKATSGSIDWAWTDDNSGNGTGFQDTWGISSDAGATWFTYDVYPLQFALDADPLGAVPEPATKWLLLATGLFGASFLMARSRAKSSSSNEHDEVTL